MDPRKRQKKLERRHAKEKAKKKALATYDLPEGSISSIRSTARHVIRPTRSPSVRRTRRCQSDIMRKQGQQKCS